MQIEIAYKIALEVGTEALLFYLENKLKSERNKKLLLAVRIAKVIGIYLIP